MVFLSWDVIEQFLVKPIENYFQQKEFEAMTAKDMAATNEYVAVEQEPYLQALDTLGVEREDVEFCTIQELETIGRIWWATVHQTDTEWNHLVNSVNLNKQEKRHVDSHLRNV
jgi:hypothetical protein